VVSQATLSGSNVGSVVATCPAGELALSGGWSIPYNSGAAVIRSSRSGTRSWTIAVYHTASVLVTSYAECLIHASGATIAERSATAYVVPNGDNSAYPTCDTGEVLVGGGFELPDTPEVEVYSFTPNFNTQWLGEARTHDTRTDQVLVYAECLTFSGVHEVSTGLLQTTSAAGGGRGSAYSGVCPKGYFVSGGGYQDSADAFVYTMHAQFVLNDTGGGSTVWAVSLYANGGHSETFWADAVCLGF